MNTELAVLHLDPRRGGTGNRQATRETATACRDARCMRAGDAAERSVSSRPEEAPVSHLQTTHDARKQRGVRLRVDELLRLSGLLRCRLRATWQRPPSVDRYKQVCALSRQAKDRQGELELH